MICSEYGSRDSKNIFSNAVIASSVIPAGGGCDGTPAIHLARLWQNPPVQMEDVPLGEGDVLLHLREGNAPYMLLTQDGSWAHLVACVLAYVMQCQDMFDVCLQSSVQESLKQPERFEMFRKTLRERGITTNERKTNV